LWGANLQKAAEMPKKTAKNRFFVPKTHKTAHFTTHADALPPVCHNIGTRKNLD
jgi:hypothetical protein